MKKSFYETYLDYIGESSTDDIATLHNNGVFKLDYNAFYKEFKKLCKDVEKDESLKTDYERKAAAAVKHCIQVLSTMYSFISQIVTKIVVNPSYSMGETMGVCSGALIYHPIYTYLLTKPELFDPDAINPEDPTKLHSNYDLVYGILLHEFLHILRLDVETFEENRDTYIDDPEKAKFLNGLWNLASDVLNNYKILQYASHVTGESRIKLPSSVALPDSDGILREYMYFEPGEEAYSTLKIDDPAKWFNMNQNDVNAESILEFFLTNFTEEELDKMSQRPMGDGHIGINDITYVAKKGELPPKIPPKKVMVPIDKRPPKIKYRSLSKRLLRDDTGRYCFTVDSPDRDTFGVYYLTDDDLKKMNILK